jgi:hypothetical protein
MARTITGCDIDQHVNENLEQALCLLLPFEESFPRHELREDTTYQ